MKLKRLVFTLFVLFSVLFCAEARESHIRTEVYIPMRDGVKLFTIIFSPKDTTRPHPFIMERTCYNAKVKAGSPKGYDAYFENDYFVVFQDVRGRNLSDGDWEDIRPYLEDKSNGETDESSDAYDTVEWLVTNVKNNNGRVGVKGVSYPGFFTTMAALSGHPAIKAVSPQAPVGDWFLGDDYHHNGAFMLADIVSYDLRLEYKQSNKFRDVEDRISMIPKLIETDIYTDYLRMGTYRNVLEAVGPERFFLDTCRVHPDYDAFWDSHAVINGHLHDIKPATLLVGGFFDKEDCFGTFATYNNIRKCSPETELYFVNGPWWHGAWSQNFKDKWGDVYFGEKASSDYYLKNIEYPFFAWYLEDKGSKPESGALIYDSGTYDYVRCPFWPSVSAKEATPFYLYADGGLSTSKEVKEKAVSYVSDPSKPVPYRAIPEIAVSRDYMIDDQRFAATRPDVVCFQTPVLSEDLTLRGEIEAELFVDISTTDADFVVKVIDVFPNGYQLMLRGEPFRGKYRESFSEPKPFKPGKTTMVRFEMPGISHTLKPGHRLMIQVQSTWFPLVDRNPQTFCNIYECDETAYVKSDIRIHCGGRNASNIKLPVVLR